MRSILKFLKRRAFEHSTWCHVAGAIGAACLLPTPFCFYVFGFNLVGILVPDAQLKKELGLDDAGV